MREIICTLLYSYILYYTLKPFQKTLIHKGIKKKNASVLLVISVLVGFLLMSIYFIPLFFRESISLAGNFGIGEKDFYKISEKFSGIKNNKILVNLLDGLYKKGYSAFMGYANDFLDNVLDFADNILAVFVIPVITYYFLCDAEKIKNKIVFLFPIKWRKIIRKIGYDTDKILSKYILSQFLLCGIVSILTFVILICFKIKYPILLSTINGVFNIIPYFGPLFGAMPSIIIAFVYSPKKAIYLTIALYAIQVLEGNIISPKITGDSVDLHPIVVIIVLILGGKISGIMGMILAIPIVVFIKIIYEDLNYYIY